MILATLSLEGLATLINGHLEAKIKLAALNFRVQVAEHNLLNDRDGFYAALTVFFKEVMPLFDRSIYAVNVSNNFDKKLEGALTYANLQKDELPLIIWDSSITGNEKAGVLVTTHAIHDNGIRTILFNDIKDDFNKITVNRDKVGIISRTFGKGSLFTCFIEGLVRSLKKPDTVAAATETAPSVKPETEQQPVAPPQAAVPPVKPEDDVVKNNSPDAGYMFCIECGNKLPVGAKFCNSCGTAQNS